MARGLTKQELREDKLAETAQRGWIWLQDHTYLAIGVVVGIVVVVLAVNALVKRQAAKTHEMETSFARSTIDFGRGNFPTAALAFENFLARYPGSRWAGEAALRSANAHFFLGNIDDAQDLYERYLNDYRGSDPYIDRAARHGLAACHEQRGEFPVAADIYEQIAQDAPSDVERVYHLRAGARCREALGDWSRARELLTQCVEAFPELENDPLLGVKLKELRAKEHLAAWQLETLPAGS